MACARAAPTSESDPRRVSWRTATILVAEGVACAGDREARFGAGTARASDNRWPLGSRGSLVTALNLAGALGRLARSCRPVPAPSPGFALADTSEPVKGLTCDARRSISARRASALSLSWRNQVQRPHRAAIAGSLTGSGSHRVGAAATEERNRARQRQASGRPSSRGPPAARNAVRASRCSSSARLTTARKSAAARSGSKRGSLTSEDAG